MEAYATIPAFEVPAKFKAEIIELIKNFGKKANIEIKNLEASNDEAYLKTAYASNEESDNAINSIMQELKEPRSRAVFERLRNK